MAPISKISERTVMLKFQTKSTRNKEDLELRGKNE